MKKNQSVLTKRILMALVLGIIFGIIANAFIPKFVNDTISKWALVPVGKMFLNAIKMLVAPLVLFSLITGAASIGDIKKLGRVGIKVVSFYLFTTALAITLALIFANIIDPGVGVNLQAPNADFETAKVPFIMDIFVNMIPTNPFESLVKGEMLQIIFFAIVFGVALTLVGDSAKPLLNIVRQANDVLLKIITLVMYTAPIGVFVLISNVVMFQGISVLIPLLKYGFTIMFVLAVQLLLVYGGALKVLGKVNPVTFFKKFWPVMVVAFSTSSSNATIPVNIDTCEKELGISNSIVSFTIPLGATVNMDGTAIMQGVATIFIAQIYGMNLTFSQMLMVILTATLASIGTAGVPGVGLIMLSMVLTQVGLPIAGIPLVLSIDRILDMMRTAVNITGDAAASVIVAKSENELDLEVFNS